MAIFGVKMMKKLNKLRIKSWLSKFIKFIGMVK